jgi:hypothetical protein
MGAIFMGNPESGQCATRLEGFGGMRQPPSAAGRQKNLHWVEI